MGNRVAATVRLQRCDSPKALVPQLLAEAERFPGPANVSFRQALHAWAKALWADRTGSAAGFPSFEELEGTGGTEMTTVLEARWDQWEAGVRKECLEQGIEQGIAQGRADLLRHQAERRFGVEAAGRLAGLLADLDSDRLIEAGDWMLECRTAGELFDRINHKD